MKRSVIICLKEIEMQMFTITISVSGWNYDKHLK